MCKPDLYTNIHITEHHGGTNTTLQKSDLGTNTASQGAMRRLQKNKIKISSTQPGFDGVVSEYEGGQNCTKMYMEQNVIQFD